MIAGILLLIAGAAASYEIEHRLPQFVREKATNILRERFASEVEFGHLSVSLFPLRLSGDNLTFRHKGRRDVPPLIFIKQFAVEGSIWGFLRTPAHVQSVKLYGLLIRVPPKDERHLGNDEKSGQPQQRDHYPVIVDQIVSTDAELDILPKTDDKLPLVFLIHQLNMKTVGLSRSAPYHATLSNPKPRGEIETSGQFGPWQRDDPGQTPLSGSYTFDHADLATFKGLSGILSSKGQFKGILERIEADGETDTPDFSLTISGHTIPLKTRFHAIIDGSNGDTLLQPVNGQFLSSSLQATGGVVRAKDEKGKVIALDVVFKQGRLEDLMRLAMKANPPMTGDIRFRTKLLILPGDQDIADRLQLDGRFVASGNQFTGSTAREKLKALSRRAQGKPNDADAGGEIFDLKGRFRLRDGIIHFSNLNFRVEGAEVALQGRYGLKNEELDFRGTLRLDATLSQTTTGFKSFLLKAVDPFFKKGTKGTVLPIKVTGSRTKPSVGLAFGGKPDKQSND